MLVNCSCWIVLFHAWLIIDNSSPQQLFTIRSHCLFQMILLVSGEEFPTHFTDNGRLYCRPYNIIVDHVRKNTVYRHWKSYVDTERTLLVYLSSIATDWWEHISERESDPITRYHIHHHTAVERYCIMYVIIGIG